MCYWLGFVFFFFNLKKARVIWENGISVEKMPSSDWSVASLWDNVSIEDWQGRDQPTVCSALRGRLCKKAGWVSHESKPTCNILPRPLPQFLPLGPLASCLAFAQWEAVKGNKPSLPQSHFAYSVSHSVESKCGQSVNEELSLCILLDLFKAGIHCQWQSS